MQNSLYTVVDFISMTPNKTVIYPRFFRNSPNNFTAREGNDYLQMLESGSSTIDKVQKLPESNKHNFFLSKQAAKTLQQKVSWLYYYAKKKTIVTRKGKVLTDLKLNFATLKLPSEQAHASDFITKNCLNQLFIEISKKYDFRNYVWRLEYQKNGNLHYHFVTDTYIDYHFLNRTWSRILNKYGYVDLYTRKFSAMSLQDYIRSESKNGQKDYNILKERYFKGVASGWKEPNCVDVKAVFGKNNIGAYIAKYMAKNEAPQGEIKIPSYEANSNNSRLWFCSRSLSKCESVKDARESFELDFYGILAVAEKTRRLVHDYCTVLYYKLDDLTAISKKVFSILFEDYRQQIGYEPAT